jgi:uncharacterized membrane protein HdeD (DUF308 family)
MISTTTEGFLLGVISTCSVLAGMFFLKFWRRTRDSLFLAFGIAFLVEGINRAVLLDLSNPNQGHPLTYVVRLLASLIILAGILHKNYHASR